MLLIQFDKQEFCIFHLKPRLCYRCAHIVNNRKVRIMSNKTTMELYSVMFTDFPDVVGVKELSNMLGICDKKVYELIRSGLIPTIPCGKVYKVAKINVIEYLFSNK